ncbi:hypothetical protein HER39_12360, partial [Arthrobacter deserti]|nr:hypothetical protein [Arthrobacter deserti]
PLGSLRYRAVAGPEFIRRWMPRSTGRDGAEWLGGVPVVDFDRKDDLQNRFFRQLTGRTLEAPWHYVPASAEFAGAARLGLGWALLPEQQCLADIRSGTLQELAPDLPLDVPLFWQRWKISSPLLDLLAEAVRRTAAETLQPGPGRGTRPRAHKVGSEGPDEGA